MLTLGICVLAETSEAQVQVPAPNKDSFSIVLTQSGKAGTGQITATWAASTINLNTDLEANYYYYDANAQIPDWKSTGKSFRVNLPTPGFYGSTDVQKFTPGVQYYANGTLTRNKVILVNDKSNTIYAP